MLIIADENMPYVREWFEPMGEVRTLPGRAIGADQLRNADALLVRSVTQVNRDLLQNSPVRFVGSATSGIEHLDTDFLQSRSIAYASAPGCNATAVVEYVLSCISALDNVLERLLAGGMVGVVGLGNVGARLVRRLQALNIRCIGYDPFLNAESGLPVADIDTVLRADVICCHTPLTTAGAYPTRHLLDLQRLRQLRKNMVLINASRGAVIDNMALLQVLEERADLRVALDVWESEPEINLSLLHAVNFGTPHIAGYSWDGKVAGTRAVLDAFCSFFRLPLPEFTVAASRPIISLAPQKNSLVLLRSAIQSVYDVRRDDARMRAALLLSQNKSPTDTNQLATVFDGLRKNYPQRREISACVIENWAEFDSTKQSLLKHLGFFS